MYHLHKTHQKRNYNEFVTNSPSVTRPTTNNLRANNFSSNPPEIISEASSVAGCVAFHLRRFTVVVAGTSPPSSRPPPPSASQKAGRARTRLGLVRGFIDPTRREGKKRLVVGHGRAGPGTRRTATLAAHLAPRRPGRLPWGRRGGGAGAPRGARSRPRTGPRSGLSRAAPVLCAVGGLPLAKCYWIVLEFGRYGSLGGVFKLWALVCVDRCRFVVGWIKMIVFRIG